MSEEEITDVVKKEDVMATYDKLDEEQAIAELKGAYLQEYVYSFMDKGVVVKGLSLVGVRETAREMNKRGLARIGIAEKEPIVKESDDYIEVWTYAKDEMNGGGYWGIKRQSKKIIHKNGSRSANRFAMEQALSKAQRNAMRGLIPEPFVKQMIDEYIKSGKVRNVSTDEIIDGDYETDEPPKQIKQPQKQSDAFDWSKLDLNKKPYWKDKQAPPIIKRLFAIAQKKIPDKNDIKAVFHSITNKEHSYEYTYGDIKKIDDYLNDTAPEPEQYPEGDVLEPEVLDMLNESFPGTVETEYSKAKTKIKQTLGDKK